MITDSSRELEISNQKVEVNLTDLSKNGKKVGSQTHEKKYQVCLYKKREDEEGTRLISAYDT